MTLMNTLLRIVAGILLIAVLVGTGYMLWLVLQKNGRIAADNLPGNGSCAHATTVRVDGNSMEPVLAAGSQITVLAGYYDCNEIQRGDIAVYRYSSERPAVVKFVAAVPGDTVALQERATGTALLVDGEELQNSEGEPYRFNAGRTAMLRLYVDQYTNGVPADTYLLLGNVPAGSFDSSQFGFVNKADFVGIATR